MTTLHDILRAQGLRTTTAREVVFRELQKNSEPVSMQVLTGACTSIDRVSIYRTLELFTRLNIVTTVHIGWKKRYELANEYQQHHHHHLICNECGSITEINSTDLERVIHVLVRSHSFAPSGHTFEITGTCEACLNN